MTLWAQVPRLPEPNEPSVHVWRFLLPGVKSGAWSMLSADERERAEGYRFKVHRDRFVAARVGLRVLLGHYLDVAPAAVVFSYSDHGKPFVDGVSFNMSHAGDVAVYAVAASHDVGIDIEQIDETVDHKTLAARFFATGEEEALRELDESLQGEAFFECWARKEAFVKAIGDGLSIPLDDFEVSIDPRNARVLRVREGSASEWRMSPLLPRDGYKGAVVIRAPNADFIFFDLAHAFMDEVIASRT